MLSRADLVSKPLLLNQGDIELKRAEIKAYFNQTQDSYEALFETLASDSAYYEKPSRLRHPLIFYFGHTSTFFTNKLMLAKLLPERMNPHIESMCAIGVDEMSWDDLNEAHYDWPTVDSVRHYRQQVRQAVNDLIDEIEFTLPIDWASQMWPIMMCIEHERIHLETSSVLIRQLPITSVVATPVFPICPDRSEAPQNILFEVPAGEITVNQQDPTEVYSWDSEYGHHHAVVEEFKAAAFLVSNQEYLEFVQAGGYRNPEYWDKEGNKWRQFSPDEHPTFWLKKDDEWWLRCLTDEIPMPWNWPVEVNNLEAAAFCHWKGHQTGRSLRLPSEDEYLRLRDHSNALHHIDQANINLQQYASTIPVNTNQTGDFFDVIGNVWQWTQTPIYPYEGFKVHPLYDDFTTPTFDNQHTLFKGGSWISTGNLMSSTSRYAFRRHFFQHAGFRYIESAEVVQTHFSTYETDTAVSQYCEFHYGESHFGVQNFAQAYAQAAIEAIQQDSDFNDSKINKALKVLEVGSSVGRASFELAHYFDEVTGVDFSARFIQVANQLKETGSVLYTMPIEGEIIDFKECSLAELNLANIANKCTFLQQDATNLKPIFTGYDMVVAANLIDRLYEPKKFLAEIHQRLNSRGLLMLTSPYTWLEDFTAKKYWLGGYKDPQTGENVSTLQGLHAVLDAEFELVGTPFDLPFVIRETQRKYQHSLSQVTLWKKRK
ncbi:5-histidylcysteine sulfoxide synthase [Thiomicrorhabdus arctica]|uniref:5-histidylcysteine sulfoxide synthase n=1 Tax=Thiomicrorhabdus arctica TaxID=131540 RepID=UPI0003635F87|nr:5-histidylcysteine sulfoxide synthase [Thiomicrorhabdus arctica]